MKALTLSELLNWKAPYQKYIIDKGILLPETRLFLFGKQESWKSNTVIHTSFCIATGIPWFGFKTVASPVYVLQVELSQTQLQTRVSKYVKGNNIYSDDIFFASERYIKLDKGFGFAALEAEIERTNAQVIILDPLFKLVSGRLSDEYDMGQFMDKLDNLIGKYRVSVILVHHTKKQQIIGGQLIETGTDDMYGTSFFMDWCDTAIRTSGDHSGNITLTFEKTRLAEDELKPLHIWIDRNTLTFHNKVV